jgi:anti-sigma B factor antagonist
MQIEDRKKGNVFIVKVRDKRLDAHVAIDFKEKMVDAISKGNHWIVLNIGEIEFIDSSGLGAIVSALKALGDRGDLVICSAKEPVMRMFKLTRMNKVFKMFDTEEEAVNALLT